MIWGTSCRRNSSFVCRVLFVWVHCFPQYIYKLRYCLFYHEGKFLGACGYIYDEQTN